MAYVERRIARSMLAACVCILMFPFAVPANSQEPSHAPSEFKRLIAQQRFQLEPVEASEDQESTALTEQMDSARRGREGRASTDSATVRTQVEGEDDASDGDTISPVQQRRELTLAHLLKLRKPMSEIRIQADVEGDADDRPVNQAGELLSVDDTRYVIATAATWVPPTRYPTAFCHRPLYYQEPDLERCGRTHQWMHHRLGCLQNAVSGTVFLVNTMVLPYRLATERPDCVVPNQGDCRTCQSTGSEMERLQPGCCGWISEAAALAGFSLLLL